MQKIAAIDTGSNAFRLVIATLDDNWQIKPVHSIRVPVRLGKDVFTTNSIQETTLQQTVDAFIQFRRIVDDFGVSRLKAVGTSAIREAQNREILISKIAQSSGIELEVIDGEEEARLVHLAVTSVIDLREKNAVLVDIGGGSVEITLTRGINILSTESYDMGTVRLLEKLDWDINSPSPLTFSLLVRKYIEALQSRIQQEIGNEKVDLCIGTGGNVEEIGKLRHKLFDQDSARLITVPELEKLIELLGRMSYHDRISKMNLRPDRADVILPAANVLKVVANVARVNEIEIPNVGLKNGILLDIANEMVREQQLPRRDQVWDSALRMGKKYQFDFNHASFVSNFATKLFDQTTELHSLGGEERLLLEIAALLHDIGHFITTIDHDKHGYYLLKANHILGLSERQQEIVACLVKYHRKGTLFQGDLNDQMLSQNDRSKVTILCALLRLADALDSSHTQNVEDIILSQNSSGWKIRLIGKEDLSLEKWAVMKRRTLFQEVFGFSLDVE